jgi:hypothetical protein
MKFSLDALRTRQRLRIRVPASPPSFVNALQIGSFGNLGAFQESSSATFLPATREGLLVIRAQLPRRPSRRIYGSLEHRHVDRHPLRRLYLLKS